MNVSDPIADMLTRIRNGSRARHTEILIPASKSKRAIAEILRDEGFIESYDDSQDGVHTMIRVQLKYVGKVPVITGLRRVWKPGLRLAATKKAVPRVLGLMGVVII